MGKIMSMQERLSGQAFATVQREIFREQLAEVLPPEETTSVPEGFAPLPQEEVLLYEFNSRSGRGSRGERHTEGSIYIMQGTFSEIYEEVYSEYLKRGYRVVDAETSAEKSVKKDIKRKKIVELYPEEQEMGREAMYGVLSTKVYLERMKIKNRRKFLQRATATVAFLATGGGVYLLENRKTPSLNKSSNNIQPSAFSPESTTNLDRHEFATKDPELVDTDPDNTTYWRCEGKDPLPANTSLIVLVVNKVGFPADQQRLALFASQEDLDKWTVDHSTPPAKNLFFPSQSPDGTIPSERLLLDSQTQPTFFLLELKVGPNNDGSASSVPKADTDYRIYTTKETDPKKLAQIIQSVKNDNADNIQDVHVNPGLTYRGDTLLSPKAHKSN